MVYILSTLLGYAGIYMKDLACMQTIKQGCKFSGYSLISDFFSTLLLKKSFKMSSLKHIFMWLNDEVRVSF